MKKLGLIIPLLAALVFPAMFPPTAHAFALYSFSASNVYWNPATKVIGFDLSNISGGHIPWSNIHVALYDSPDGLYAGGTQNLVNLSSTCNNSHCTATLDGNVGTDYPPADAQVGIYIQDPDENWDSTQTFRLGSIPTDPIQVSSLSGGTINPGDTYTETGSFSDPNSNVTSETATVDYGDGAGPQSLSLNGSNFALNHQYSSPGRYTVSVNVTDSLGLSAHATTTVTVNQPQPPAIGTITVSANPVQVNSQAVASAPFTDSASNTGDTASWDWGDGTTSQGTVTEANGSGTVSDSHTYTTSGVYTLTLTVTDQYGVSSSQSYQYVSVYSPTTQGLFSAGQKYTSPAGAYIADSTITGSVKFGLSYKYQGTVPVGKRQFTMDFKAANFAFNATTVSSLVTSNGIATLQGTGTINGSGNYNFTVVGDGNANTIHIVITDQLGNTVYDTQRQGRGGTDITVEPNTSVTGNVVVH